MKLLRQLELWLGTLLLLAIGLAEFRHARDRHQEILDHRRELTDGYDFEQYLGQVDWVLNDFAARMAPLIGLYLAWLLLHFGAVPRLTRRAREATGWLMGLGAVALLLGGVLLHAHGFRSGHYLETTTTPPDSSSQTLKPTKVLPESGVYVPPTEKKVVVLVGEQRPRRVLADVLLLLFILAGYEALAQFVYWLHRTLEEQGTLARWRIPPDVGLGVLLWASVVVVLGASGLLRPRHEPIPSLLTVDLAVWFAGSLLLSRVLLPRFSERPVRAMGLFAVAVAPVLSALGGLLSKALTGVVDPVAAFLVIWAVFLVVVMPAAYWQFLRRQETRDLQTSLSTKGAELAALRAQVNPHFLFNALNTLYASALQEGSERTATGLQKLGDLMRFMLHDNAQDTIDLSRELQYLRGYVELQQLRLGEVDTVDIRVELPETGCPHQVAPMLLVPFVENAFKHGISLRRPSWIFVRVRCEPGIVHLDVQNSRHPRPLGEVPDEASGVGLDNVRKRLNLLYPNRHTLALHQTEREFSATLEIRV